MDAKGAFESIDAKEISVPSSPSKEQEIFHHNYIEDPEYFEKLIDNVDLTYIRGEDDLTPPRPKSEFPVVNSWDSFEIDDIDIIKVFNSLRNSNLPRKNPEVQQSAILGILGLTRQHKLTKNKLITIWSDLLNDFQLDVVWNMIELDRSEIEVFDNMKVIRKSTNFLVQHVLFYRIANASYIILSAHLKILKSYFEHSKLPINEGELMIRFVAPLLTQESEQQLTASRERRKEANKERARIGQKTDIIIELLTGPALICEVSGGLPAGCPKKIWTDKVDVIVFGCQVIGKCFAFIVCLEILAKMYFMLSSGLQLNLYAMDTRTTGIYRFGTID
ncbi:11865_t:CDS:2 [Rhizophagus irregularis]|nr:11865_t:CDS:2 [Rhizophagus irregularis]